MESKVGSESISVNSCEALGASWEDVADIPAFPFPVLPSTSTAQPLQPCTAPPNSLQIQKERLRLSYCEMAKQGDAVAAVIATSAVIAHCLLATSPVPEELAVLLESCGCVSLLCVLTAHHWVHCEAAGRGAGREMAMNVMNGARPLMY